MRCQSAAYHFKPLLCDTELTRLTYLALFFKYNAPGISATKVNVSSDLIPGMNNALRRQEPPRELERQSQAQRMLAPQSEGNVQSQNLAY